MLKKLKRKFIIINMALVGGVLIFMLTVICINTYKSQTDLAEDNLSNVLTGELITFDDHFIPFHVKDDDNNGHNQNKKFIPAAVVEMNPSGISVECSQRLV